MSLDIPESGVSLESGWNIKPLNIKVAMCRVIYIYIDRKIFVLFLLAPLHNNFSDLVILSLIFTSPSISLLALNLFQFQKHRVDSVQLSSRHIPSCRLQLQYAGKELQPPSFSQELKITGVNVSRISIGIPPPKGER